ncbi:MAG TPA: orotate phosphoribosyltransferase [Bryobacteraceae bacterium]|jgi:orotate phosphoribosyltransferase|nr:orotate phosphoribosyltransferase [Bryobacteraceae bacterium]
MGSSTMALFAETGAYLRGHFRLTSGLHSGEYLQCAKVLAYPAYAERLGQALAQRLRPVLEGATVTVVSAPAMGGLIIGHEVARAFGVPFLFSERDAATNEMTVRRGFSFKPEDRAVVIEDVVTTGGSTREVIRLLRQAGVEVLAAGSIIDRSNGSADVGAPRVALEQVEVVAYKPEDCPLCRQGLPLVKPGSKRV